ncbi:MAG: restriction endonuclease [Deltaproteobacteria bacterium]|nr:restriction endonuclease [Deltaproteobacteria bacterium]
MTFIEAALEILRREGIPLHARVIAEKAVELEILSHVGKTPEQTMSKRISAAVAKEKGPFVRVKPGVFALSEWKDDKGSLVPPGRTKRPTVPPVHSIEKRPHTPPQQTPVIKDAPVMRPSLSPVEATERENGREKGAAEENERTGDDGAGRSRKNRNRRSRNRNRDTQRNAERRVSDGERTEKNDPPTGVSEIPRADVRGDNSAERRSAPPVRTNGENGGLVGEVARFLEKQKQPQGARAIAGRFQIGGNNAEIIIDALLDADNRERRKTGRIPRFVKHRNGWALSVREIPAEIVTIENEVFQSAFRLEQIAERQILRRLKGISSGKLTQIVILILRQMGYSDVESIARGREGECHLRVSDRRHGGRFSTAVVIRHDAQSRAITDADVAAFRGSLHHYKASRGLVVTTGEITPEGIREADIPNLPPVGIIDGRMLAQEMVRYSIGVEKRAVQLAFLDESWF